MPRADCVSLLRRLRSTAWRVNTVLLGAVIGDRKTIGCGGPGRAVCGATSHRAGDTSVHVCSSHLTVGSLFRALCMTSHGPSLPPALVLAPARAGAHAFDHELSSHKHRMIVALLVMLQDSACTHTHADLYLPASISLLPLSRAYACSVCNSCSSASSWTYSPMN